MRVAYVCADRGVPVFGGKGGSIHVQEVLRGMLAAGAEVDLFARRTGGDAPGDLRGIRVHRLPRSPRGEIVIRERADLRSNDTLRALLIDNGPFDLVYERHALWSFAGMEHAQQSGIPGLLEVNAPLLTEQRKYRQLILGDEAERAVARAYGAASALLAVSRGVAAALEEHSSAGERIHVVPNGVDPARFDPDVKPALPDPTAGFTIGFVGTLKPWHGVETLVEVFTRIHRTEPATRLLVVGDGPQRAELDAMVATRALGDAVVFCGSVEPSRIPPLLSSMDVAVAPYPPLDGFYFSPLKLFEYMASGRPIVAAGIGQIAELIEDDVTGLLYPAGDAAALETALRRLMTDEPLRRRLGTAARRLALREHSWQSVVGRILAIAGRSATTDPALPQTR